MLLESREAITLPTVDNGLADKMRKTPDAKSPKAEPILAADAPDSPKYDQRQRQEVQPASTIPCVVRSVLVSSRRSGKRPRTKPMLPTQPAILDNATYGSLMETPYVNQATEAIDMNANGSGFRSPISLARIAARTAAVGAKYSAEDVRTPTLGAKLSAI